MKVRIEIDTKTFVRFWLVVIGFAAVILALYSARTALTIIGASLFLALALNTPVSALARRLPGKSRMLSTAIAFLAVVAILVVFIFLVVPPIVQQTLRFIDAAPAAVSALTDQWQGLKYLVEQYHIQPQLEQAVKSIQGDAARIAGEFSSNVISGVGSAISWFIGAILGLVLTFLMLVEGPTWMRRIWSLYTDQDRLEAHKHLIRRMHGVVSSYVGGQLTVSGIDALCGGAVVFILSQLFHEVPANLALPAIAILFILSLIPMFGATLGGVLIALLLALNNPVAGIIFIAYFIIYQQIENNIIAPTIQSRGLELTPLAVLIAVTIGIYVFGVIGAVISIPIAGCIKVLIEYYLERGRHKRVEDKKPLTKLVKKMKNSEA